MYWVFLGIAELTIRSFSFSSTSANLFSVTLWKSATARCVWFSLSQTAGTASLMRALWPLSNELQRAPVTEHKILFSDRRPLLQ